MFNAAEGARLRDARERAHRMRHRTGGALRRQSARQDPPTGDSYARTNKGLFYSAPDEPNGHTFVTPGTDPATSAPADVTVLDMRLLASLLFQNGTRDPVSPRKDVDAYFRAASAPKERRSYDAPHELDAQALADRDAWLVKLLLG